MTIAAEARTIDLPFPLFRAMLEAAAAGRSPADAAELLRQAGFSCGEPLHALLEEHLSAQTAMDSVHALPAAEFWDAFRVFWSSFGWGDLEHRRLRPGIDELRSADWAEAEAASATMGCQLTTGLLADVLSRVAEEDVAVLEVECRSRGAERCRFLIGGPEALEALYERLRAGTALAEALDGLG